MKRLSEDQYSPDSDGGGEEGTTAQADEGSTAQTAQGPHVEEGETTTTYTTEEPEQDTGTERLLPDGMNTIEGEIPPEMMGEEPVSDEGEGAEGEPGDEEGAEQATAEGQETAGEDEAGETEAEGEEMDDVNASQGWVNEFTKKTGLQAESEEEAIEKVRTMHRDVQGFSQMEQVLEQVPQAAQLMHGLAQTEGEIDPVDFYMAAQDVDGLQVNAPSKAEDPDGYADFKAKLNQRKQKMEERRQQREEMQKKQEKIRKDFEQAFESFRQRKNLDQEEAEEFKQEFARTFYGDAEAGELPRMDVFDLAYEAMRGGDESEDVPPEETEEYQAGYNKAVEDMKSGGADTDGLPDLKDSAGTGENDGGAPPTGGNVPSLLDPSGDEPGMNHDQF